MPSLQVVVAYFSTVSGDTPAHGVTAFQIVTGLKELIGFSIHSKPIHLKPTLNLSFGGFFGLTVRHAAS